MRFSVFFGIFQILKFDEALVLLLEVSKVVCVHIKQPLFVVFYFLCGSWLCFIIIVAIVAVIIIVAAQAAHINIFNFFFKSLNTRCLLIIVFTAIFKKLILGDADFWLVAVLHV